MELIACTRCGDEIAIGKTVWTPEVATATMGQATKNGPVECITPDGYLQLFCSKACIIVAIKEWNKPC